MSEEKKTKVKLTEKQYLAGQWYDAGKTVEVYEQEASALVKRGKAEEAKK